jgi:transposase, IS5 family
MRKVIHGRRSQDCQWPVHEFTVELQVISSLLDEHPEILTWVHDDLMCDSKHRAVGAPGMTAEQVLRSAIIKQQNEWTYRELAIQGADSAMTRAFTRLACGEYFGKSCLQENIGKISAATWAKINAVIIVDAKDEGIDSGRTVRMDSTVVEADIHHPTDSTLLYDCLRVIWRELKKIRDKWPEARLYFAGSLKEAKLIVIEIASPHNADKRKSLYRKLLKLAKKARRRLGEALSKLDDMTGALKAALAKPQSELRRIADLLPGVIAQTEQRVLNGKQLPPDQKVVSIFEPHADIIKKGQREVEFGHKVLLTTGKSGLVLDCRIEDGNPADQSLFLPLVKTQAEIFGQAPRQTSADGGFASQENIDNAKQLGVKDVCFSKLCGLKMEAMTKSKWVFEKLRRFRAGIEGVISVLKRAFGLERATWKGRDGFHAYVQSAVVAYNLTVIARAKSA